MPASDLIEAVIGEFRQTFGYGPSGVWSAPGRANLIGEHTDYNLGFVFPFGIDSRTYAAVSLREDRVARVASAIDGKTYEFNLDEDSAPVDLDWAGYPLGVAWVMRDQLRSGFECYIDSNVPVGAGLSSSAAIECAVATALNDLNQLNLDRKQLAQIGQQAENKVVGAPTGIMDQMASMLAQQDSAVLIDCRTLDTEVISLGLQARGLVIAVIDTGVKHRHADGGYGSRRASCELGAKLMGVASLRDLTSADLPRAAQLLDDETFRRVKHIVTENERVVAAVSALKAGDMPGLGRLLDASHVSMRDDFEISIDELDEAVLAALDSGAVGARMTGGGFGGAAIALIEQSKLPALRGAVEARYLQKGYSPANIFLVSPESGAARDR
jgi:galactokinase